MAKKVKKKRKILSPIEKDQKRRKNRLSGLIKAIFKFMAFSFCRTNGLQLTIGKVTSEIDYVFIHQNLIVIVEDTISASKDHLRKKNDFFQAVLANRDQFFELLKKKFPDNSELTQYLNKQFIIQYIYCTENKVEEETREEYNSIKYLDIKPLNYFKVISSSIKQSAFNEFLKFLGYDLSDIGNPTSEKKVSDIDSAVIIPESSSGFPEGIQLISFVMKAKELMDCSYVFRKDSWNGNTNFYYQRLMEPSKIQSIRRFLAKEKRTFIDNIIVSLPQDVKFARMVNGEETAITDITKEGNKLENLIIKIPYKINSIGIIDGQHRVFSHYIGSDNLEKDIEQLRNKRHLLVTGLYYDKNKFTEQQKRKFESELFLQINSNQRNVDSSLLQYIENLKSPNSSIGLAWSVLNALNDRSPFYNLFAMSKLDKKGVKTPTIIKYGFRGLVDINENKETFFKYWNDPEKDKIKGDQYDEDKLNEYVKFCSRSLSQYFNAIKEVFPDYWSINNKESRLLSVTSIVAFLQSYSLALNHYRKIESQQFFKTKISQLRIDFTPANFKFVSSQWPKFVDIIEKQCWT